MPNNLDQPFYYLDNFRFVLRWVQQRYGELLDAQEAAFIAQFATLPIASQALLVRMVMRNGDFFRVSKLRYGEIGDTAAAAQALIALNWVALDPVVTIAELFGLLTKQELAQALQLTMVGALKKTALLELVEDQQPRRFSAWCAIDQLLALRVSAWCDRIRLMFFGNLYQDWSEFVLADLGIYRYEPVAFPPAARAFQTRADVDQYLCLHHCRERLESGDGLGEIEAQLDTLACDSVWLQSRRAKLLFRIGQEYERSGELQAALRCYAGSRYCGARVRQMRVLEKLQQIDAAYALAQTAMAAPESSEELQQVLRMVPRLQRGLGLPVARRAVGNRGEAAERIDLVLRRVDTQRVEEAARQHIHSLEQDASVYYVENALINSLFGLLCWDAIFLAVPGAFFHPFQSGPADLHSADFRALRGEQFRLAFDQLDSDQYRETIRSNYASKAGIQSPFVFWEQIDAGLLELALDCLPGAHLKKYFERLLENIAANRSGFPDLIQFWPAQRRYRMIEVKGPGDRLQDNQLRFLAFCAAHQLPVAVCYVDWATS